MAKPPILDPERSYTFRSYFEMTYDPEDILAEFGYRLQRARITLPQGKRTFPQLAELEQRIERTLPVVSLTSETARRETLVAPILIEIAAFCNCQLKIEYPLNVSQWLKGNLDYLLRSDHEFLIIEAKNDDLSRGFTQLAVELIALAKQQESLDPLFGAVTIGEVWRFGQLDPQKQQITQDLELFKLPGDLDSLVSVLIGIMEEQTAFAV
ncbi:hypothetical protein D0962_30610 [Leptolyngbyaceae cyanobacterium CCMR0082]|uniref:Type I restriction enzyme R protein N-terminal domain-containing protein n=2 Tax=Adonisia turfae TaxID=2950184 RepID=A0A6M0SF31_9CYAN|nr:hypothetical protein [Adonisia turfae]MDV3353225.1 hypothetical protein [Leptothoe sp. LEGE 181152]NEZ56837.1 hypothetical protein [Adonisia turfae CCMR0081]NEZ67054.1 hypothetical protein [Adonisia turfae CCMR0082]